MQKQELKPLKKVWQPYKVLFLFIGVILINCSAFSQPAEVNLLHNINPSNPSSNLWKLASSSAYPVSAGVPTGLLIAGFCTSNKEMKKKGLVILGSLAINTVLTEGLKLSINRERPYEKYPNLITSNDISEKGKSFPSAHTSEVFAMATSVSLQYKKWYIILPAYSYAAAIGYSRLYLGDHYPSDVLAGAIIGAGSAYLSNWLSKKILK